MGNRKYFSLLSACFCLSTYFFCCCCCLAEFLVCSYLHSLSTAQCWFQWTFGAFRLSSLVNFIKKLSPRRCWKTPACKKCWAGVKDRRWILLIFLVINDSFGKRLWGNLWIISNFLHLRRIIAVEISRTSDGGLSRCRWANTCGIIRFFFSSVKQFRRSDFTLDRL